MTTRLHDARLAFGVWTQEGERGKGGGEQHTREGARGRSSGEGERERNKRGEGETVDDGNERGAEEQRWQRHAASSAQHKTVTMVSPSVRCADLCSQSRNFPCTLTPARRGTSAREVRYPPYTKNPEP